MRVLALIPGLDTRLRKLSVPPGKQPVIPLLTQSGTFNGSDGVQLSNTAQAVYLDLINEMEFKRRSGSCE